MLVIFADDLVRAVDLLHNVIKNEWDIRFTQIQVTAVTDLVRLLKYMEEQNVHVSYQKYLELQNIPRLNESMECDLRVTLSW